MDEIRTIATQAGSTQFTAPELIRIPESTNFYVRLNEVINQRIALEADETRLTLQSMPQRPALGAVSLVDDVTVPDLQATAPSINLPAVPKINTPNAPGVAPAFNSPTLPDAPGIVIPTAPTLNSVVIPDAPLLDIPSFTDTLDVQDIPAPSYEFTFAELPYHSAMQDALKAKLLFDLEHGGYGIDTADEAALWNRERDREGAEATIQLGEVARNYAGRGFPFPPGAMVRAMEQVSHKLMAASQSSSREIALKRADLYVQNRQFTLTQVRELESLLMNYHGAMLERMLNTAKAIADYAITTFRAKVDRYNLELERYKTEAAVFGDRIRALVERVGIYRAQLEAADLQGRLELQKVDVYKALMSGVEMAVNVYRTQMEAVGIQAGIERDRMEAYRASIDAFVASVNAEQSKLQLYDAQVKGELAKVQVFQAQVEAHNATLNGVRAKTDVKVAKARAEIDRNNALLEAHRADLNAYETQLRAEVSRVDTHIKAEGFRLQEHESHVRGVTEIVRADAERNKTIVAQNEQINQTRIRLKELEAQVERAGKELALNASQSGAQIYGQMISSALAAVNAIATISDDA